MSDGYGGNQKLTGKKEVFKYTREQLLEIKKCRNDFEYFANYCMIVHPDHGKIPFHPYDFQSRIAKKAIENRYLCCLLFRQAGKCLQANTKYRVRNKNTGEIYYVTAAEFHEMLK